MGLLDEICDFFFPQSFYEICITFLQSFDVINIFFFFGDRFMKFMLFLCDLSKKLEIFFQ